MEGLNADQIRILVTALRHPFFTPVRKAAVIELAEDLLSEHSTSQELASRYALFIALISLIQ